MFYYFKPVEYEVDYMEKKSSNPEDFRERW